MDTPPNILLVPKSPSPQRQYVEKTPDIERFLELFESRCVVACCEWDAIAATEDEIYTALQECQTTVAEVQELVERLHIWNQTLTAPVFINGSHWYWNPISIDKNLRQFSELLSEMTPDETP